MTLPTSAPAGHRLCRRAAALCLAALAACDTAPPYRRPEVDAPPAYKEAASGTEATWTPASPPDRLDRGPWWQLFGDAGLDRLVDRIDISNQNVAAAAATYRQARALVAQQRAGYFPTVTLNATGQRSGGDARGPSSNDFQASLGASWEPDLWSRISNSVRFAEASAEAREADIAAARLSAQAELATDYFSLREADAEIALVARTVEGYRRSLEIASNRYAVGIAPRTDVLQAETLLASTQADLSALRAQRQQLEHAIALLVGEAPARFAIAPAEWAMNVPEVPAGVPSELLERRPDIASAERSVAAANAQIGVERSAYFPQITLSASGGIESASVGNLFQASSTLWSFGVSLVQLVFDAGARRAVVEAAEAGRDVNVALYRQTVLTAFREVEDDLSSNRALAEQLDLRQEASEAADLVEQQIGNRYRAGQVSYTDVVTAQASALNARRSLVQLQSSRQTAAITLIQALGGGWNEARMTEAADAAAVPASGASEPTSGSD